jgi:Zn-dependent protease with chaperone function
MNTIKPKRLSRSRQTAAVLLMILCFYGLTLGAAALLTALAFSAFTVLGILGTSIGLMCLAFAAVIVWTVFPRPSSSIVTLPRVTPTQEPMLFKAISEVAHAMGQAPPAAVYISPDINASVREQGGWLGFGSQRQMLLGLPLAQVLTVAEFKSVIAHELGHFQAGDTKLSPWIYRLRVSIGQSLRRVEWGLLELPTLWFGKLFLRASMGLSREKEFEADAAAARVAGPAATADALRKINTVSPLFPAYWESEAIPLLEARYRPSITHGFTRYLKAKRVRAEIAKAHAASIEKRKVEEFDTHPPFVERVAAVEALPKTKQRIPDDTRPAITLFQTVESLEFELLVELGGVQSIVDLDPIDWIATGEKVYLPMWAKTVKRLAPKLRALDPSDLPGRALDVEGMTRSLVRVEMQDAPPEVRRAIGLWVLGAALAYLLHRKGHRFDCAVGEEVVFRHRDAGASATLPDGSPSTLEPFKMLWDLSERKITPTEWAARCEAFGIAGAGLGGEDLELKV